MKPGAAARLARPVRFTAVTPVLSRPDRGRRGFPGSPRRLRRPEPHRPVIGVTS